MNQKNIFKTALLVLIIPLISGCVTIYNPATEQKETLLINTEREVSLGANMDKQMQEELKILDDFKLKVRLNSIGGRVARISDRQDLRYNFRVVEDKEFNAFALPGGFVYINNGLMEAANDDELACVVAHEVGHIAARHSVKKLQSALGYQLILGIALGVSEKQTMGQALDVVFNLVNLGYSRKDEHLADKLSVKYAMKAGFDPYGMVTFFEKLKAETSSKSSHYKPPVFLSSHPSIDERIERVKSEITLYQAQ
ncbi:MAG: M48 family metalloprotease [Candidatus Omnitrophica bacterium]|nr:M48 family metalloprotease [Candidatus Omnitrophota bacterium]